MAATTPSSTRRRTDGSTDGAKPARKSRAARTARIGATPMIDPERRRALIAEAAYYRAERRGFAPGDESADWLAAEVEVDTALTAGTPGNPAIQ